MRQPRPREAAQPVNGRVGVWGTELPFPWLTVNLPSLTVPPQILEVGPAGLPEMTLSTGSYCLDQRQTLDSNWANQRPFLKPHPITRRAPDPSGTGQNLALGEKYAERD